MVLLCFTIIYMCVCQGGFYVTQGIKSVSNHYREMPKFVMNSWYEVVLSDIILLIFMIVLNSKFLL